MSSSHSDAVFDAGAGPFLARLARNNNREWFREHRQDYDDLIAEPLEYLLATAAEFGPGRVMRPNRDVRFSKDKTPYRTTFGMWAGSFSGVYLQIGADGLQAGGGIYEPGRDHLTRAREIIDQEPRAAEALSKALARLTAQGFSVAGPSLTTAPRGYPRDHEFIDLLRLRHYAALAPLPLTASLDDVHRIWHTVKPLNAWIDQHLLGRSE